MPLEGYSAYPEGDAGANGFGCGVCYPRGYSVCLQLHRCQLHLCRKQSSLRPNTPKSGVCGSAPSQRSSAAPLLSLPLMWQLADIIMACMAITNLTAILLFSPVVHTIASDYLRQRKLGVRPVFDPLRYPEIGRQLSRTRGMMFRRSNHYRSTHSLLLKSA